MSTRRFTTLLNLMETLANSLLLSDHKNILYRMILESGASLLGACQGSVMVVDRNGKNMHTVHAMGLSSDLTCHLTMQIGSGIAGSVAESGTPLLVSDVEKDKRVARRNRPRFKSKALISVPMKIEDKVIGVLNLSDKSDLNIFTEEDLALISSFSTIAALLIERTVMVDDISSQQSYQ